ncbi:acidic mammalian chitinase-like [Eurosta solidaginis]|uniref:acidic mammalian chitinase-like n=1 Tax=Eurosta solidaginis TaxID=178769 RepID=UPI0035306337
MFAKLFLLIALGVVLQQHAAEAASASPVEKKKIVCYYGTWATYRQGNGKHNTEDIDPRLCTHLMYSFFGIHPNGSIRLTDPWLDEEEDGGLGNIKRFNNLKLINPKLKTIAAVGGWNEGSEKFAIVANDPQLRKTFVNESIALLLKYGFDGLDMDWEYPKKRNELGYDDKANFVSWCKELKEAFIPYNFSLSAAVSATEDSVKISYDVPGVSKYLDFINIMAYDLNGPWDGVTGFNAALLPGQNDVTAVQKQLNVEAIVNYWLEAGAPASKLILGVPFYGHSFTLTNASVHGLGAPITGPGPAGPYSGEGGTINYIELCEKQLTEPWTAVWDDVQKVPYTYINQTWVSYDNIQSITLKTELALKKQLGGIMVWSIESDDFRGLCGPKYALLQTINKTLAKAQTKQTIISMVNNYFKQINDFFSEAFSF